MSARGKPPDARPVICVASAGTGKTHWLTEQFFAALKQDGFRNPHRLLAITFTENAANEMRSRIQSKMVHELGLQALQLAVELNICTIHSFCRAELTRHAVELGLNPALEVLDEPHAGRMAREVLLGVLRERHRSGSQSFRLLAANLPFNSYFSVSRGTSLERALLELYRKLRSRGVIELAPELFVLAAIPWEEARARVSADLAHIERLSPAQVKNPKSRDKLEKLLETIRRHRKLLQDLQPSEVHARALQEVFAACNMNVEKKLKPELTPFKGIREDGEWVKGSYHQAMQAIAAIAAKPLRDEVIGILADVDAHLNARKRATGVMDFEDLQLEFLRALKDNQELQASYRQRFTGVFVDEFQDTNPLQVQLIELMAEKPALRYVGDPKQSVYGWRFAEPETIRQRRNEFETSGRVQKLRHNFRSRPEILEFVNALCGLWGDALGFEYDALIPAAVKKPEFGFRGERRPCVEAFLAPASDEGERLRADEARPVMAEAVAAYIKHAVEEQRFRHTSLKRQDAPLNYGDFTILLRKNNLAPHYEAALACAGIPFVSATSTGFLEAPEIAAAVGLLRTLLMPENDRLLAETLRSDFVGLSSCGLAELAAAARAPSRGEREVSFNQALLQGVNFSLAEDAAAVQEFLQWREELAAGMEMLTPAGVLEAAVQGLRLREKLIAQGAPERALVNLEKLLDLALGVSACGLGGIAELVRTLDEKRYQGESIGEMWLEGLENVRIMTVHKAKGLTLPVVILAEADAQTKGDSPLLTVEPDERAPGRYELGVNHRFLAGGFKEPFYQRHLEAESERAAKEEARLLYVALTRAVEHIAIFGLNPQPDKKAPWRALLAPVVETQGSERVVAERFAGLVEVLPLPKGGPLADRAEVLSLDELIARHAPETASAATAAAQAEALRREADQPVGAYVYRYLYSASEFSEFLRSGAVPAGTRLDLAAAEAEEGIPVAAAQDEAGPEEAIKLGNAIHALLAHLLSHPEPGAAPVLIPALLHPDYAARWLAEHAGALLSQAPRAERLLNAFFTLGLPQETARAVRAFCEHAFLLRAEPVFIRGRMDLLLVSSSSLAVVDYKTDQVPDERRKRELLERYRPQMLTYAYAARTMFPRLKIRAGLAFLDCAELLWLDNIEDELRGLEQKLAEFAHEVASGVRS